MMNEWQEFLTTQQAQIDDQGRVTFPSAEADPERCLLLDLSHLGLIAVRGKDAVPFLQGQLTNDVREVTASHSQLSAHCSQKGRMLGLFRVFQLADDIYLQTPIERVAALVERLSRFVLRSQVKVEDASSGLARMGLAGRTAGELLGAQGLPAPAKPDEVAPSDDLAIVRLPGPLPRFELIGPASALIPVWRALAGDAAPANASDWRLLDIQGGIPSVYDATAEAFVPQMTNLQLINGLSFHKGCYTGQEVVARMQFLGSLKRRMYLSEARADAAPQPGDELFTPASTSRQTTGRVVDVTPLGDDRYALLVVAEIGAADGGDVRLGEQGPSLVLRDPPYGFPAAEADGAHH